MVERPAPPDQTARDRIGSALGETLFVEAGAGSGKTTALVGRVLSLVTGEGADGRSHPPVPLSGIAAITFTEKAGAELRERLRRSLEEAATADPDHPRAERCRAALDELDGAAIGTLHSFAQRILVEHPVEAGLPPRVEVLDEVTSGVEFEQRWARFSDELYTDPAYARTFLLLFAAGVRDTTPHALARTFDANWDLVDELVDPDAPPPRPAGPRVAGVLDRVEEVCALVGECIDPTDLLCLKLQEVGEWAATVRAAPDEEAQVEALRQARAATSTFRPRGGRKGSWRVSSDEVKADLRALEALVDDVLREIADECAHHLGAAIRRFTLASAGERRSRGTLEFHDLLVLARALLRDPVHGGRTRQVLHERYQRLLLDEFQDTDPIQIELAVRIAAADPRSPEAAAPDWRDVPVAAGRLFVVGDPKQSIYRFRRADIGVFLDAQRLLAADGGGHAVTLTANFRTVPGITDWVNATFATLMAEPPDDELPLTPRPDYTPLDAVRPDPAPDAGPTVSVLGRHAHTGRPTASEVRTAEAADVVATIRRAHDERWQVGAGAGGWRDASLGDITILVPARTSLPFLEDALSEAGIAYRTEASSLVYASRAVRDLLLVVRAVADPTDELRTVSALRTPLFGCGDDDLYRFRVERGGHWTYTADQPDTVPADDPVRVGLEVLRTWHEERAWTSPSALLDRIVRDRRAMELAFAEGRPRDVWRRLRFVVDQARAWTDATGGDLRGYLGWIGHQTEEGARVAEAILPETDDDAVRIMTIHAAKGLEFPITIVSGATSYPRRAATAGDAKFTAGGVAYYLGKHAETSTYTANRPVDEQMDLDERVRLLYVATTRAKDHLVVSLHRVERKKEPAPANRTNAELLLAGMGELLDALPDGPPAEPAPRAVAPAPAAVAPLGEPLDEWADARDAALAAASRPTTVAATALTDEGRPDVERADASPCPPAQPPAAGEASTAEDEGGQLALDFATVAVDHDLDQAPDGDDAGLHKRPGDLDRPPWLKGRYGTAVGRAVHGVLQTVPLSSEPGDPLVAAAVAAQAAAEAVTDKEPVVAQLVHAALGSPSVREAAGAPHWREVFASTPVGDRLLEGYVDLLYRGPGGLVVVDYKTAATADPAELDRRVDGYRVQGASYALAVGGSTGEAVVRVTFCFLTPQGVVERHLGDLDAAMAEVEALVRAGAEVEVDRPGVVSAAP
ncbi:UvrD-helicase domain-containing protein [Iamia sp. SCSIO 61187]|uniref:UvrD-helicase domain-containing protein n=1 Tax=Iamia sp. SCSIO 61187 TaxID=2722752 RepID=UPI001C626CBA|nr:UvrD-helicase domain-containing protein [Iamia sp. SCSIO 61187]QYG91429.1 UvrD-helicase domain-containing protein [Iamia sp. SCSIO 61187]